MHASVVAHPNIALVKYWGKRDSRLNLPAAGSLSLTLGPVATRTTLTFGAEEDSLELNGVAVPATKRVRVATVLERVRDRVALEHGPAARAELGGARIISTNDFPTAAGLASSSSGFAALALAATSAAGLHLSLPQLSALAREGSGSAARSLFGGFARMHAGSRPDGTDAFAEPLFDEHHWDLSVVIAVTVEGEKEVASTDGMNLTERTSPYYPAWIETVEPDVQSAITAIAARDFDHLARIAEASALRMHASAIAADPGVLYWRGATVEVIHEVRRLRAGGLPVFFTIDAGPHVKVFAPTGDVDRVARALEAVPGVLRTITTRSATGAHLIHG